MPQDTIALHSCIFSKGIRKIIKSDDAHIKIWRMNDKDTIDVKEYVCKIHEPMIINAHGWTVITDSFLINKLQHYRQNKLPNETGGVLIGTYDTQRKIAYIVDTIPSPPDSKEWPTVYIRGCKGLELEVNKVGKITDGMLKYVGEWHSHPKGMNANPSQTDIQAFAWLTEEMNQYGYPALMLILGENYQFYIGQINKS